MTENGYIWVSIVAVYVFSFGIYPFLFAIWRQLANHLQTEVNWIKDRIYDMAKDIALIKGRLGIGEAKQNE